MPEASLNFAEVRFLDRDQVIRNLRQPAAEAKARYPEIVKVYLFGSLVQGTWAADSDADLIVVVGRSLRSSRKAAVTRFIRSRFQPIRSCVRKLTSTGCARIPRAFCPTTWRRRLNSRTWRVF